MEDLIYSISSIFSSPSASSPMPAELLPLSMLFAAFGALILGRFTGNMGGLTLPINFSALFIGATLANSLLHNVDLQIDRTVQQPLFVSIFGMIFASIAMMLWIQSDRAKV